METPRQKKTVLDRLMQVISVAVTLMVLTSLLNNVSGSEQRSPHTARAGLAQTTPSPAATRPAVATEGTAASNASQRSSQVEPLAGSWPTWVLKSGREIKVPPPPGAQATAAELDVLRDLASKRDAAALAAIEYWDAGSPSYRWVQLALQQLQAQPAPIPRANHALAMLNVAVYESIVTVWQAKYTYGRPRPADHTASLAAIATPASPSYPDERAAAAGAASAILSFLYPEQADMFADMAWQAGRSRLQAGVAFPSDVEAGLSLGRAVAERVITYTGLRGTFYDGPGIAAWWQTLALAEPLSPPWRPWTLAFAGEFLPAAPASGKAETTRDDVLKLKQMHRIADSDVRSAALAWNSFIGTHEYWYDLAAQKMAEYHLDEDPPRAARIYALMSIAHDDASNACWDAIDTYGVLWPSQISADDAPLLAPTTRYSYPSVQGCLAGSMSTILATVFPLDARAIRATSEEAADAGLWIDGAMPDDIRAGFALGRSVALHVLSHPLSWLWGGE